jgi:lysophospholipase L1-like esterase
MKGILIIFVLFSFNCCSQQGILGIGRISNIDFTGKNVVFVGNSITAGTAASDAAHRYTNIFATGKSATLVNMGIGGQVIQAATMCGGLHPAFDRTTIPSYSGSYAALFIALGVNDIGVNNGLMTSTDFKSDLESIIDYAVATKGWAIERIILITPFWCEQAGRDLYVGSCGVSVAADEARADDYALKITEAASEKGCILADVYTAMKDSASPSSLISGDGLHPNNTGHAFIAAYLLSLSY